MKKIVLASGLLWLGLGTVAHANPEPPAEVDVYVSKGEASSPVSSGETAAVTIEKSAPSLPVNPTTAAANADPTSPASPPAATPDPNDPDQRDVTPIQQLGNQPPASPIAPTSTEPTAPASPTAVASNTRPTPLMLPPIRLFNLDTANTLPAGTIQFTGGVRTYSSNPNLDPGNGLQVFYGGVDGAINDRLQLGLAATFYDDPLYRFVQGLNPDVTILSLAPTIKYQLFKGDNLSWAIGGSIEAQQWSSNNLLFTNGLSKVKETMLAASIQSPFTWSFDPEGRFQWHLTPSIVFMESGFGGGNFYGTSVNIGTGFNWKFHEQISFFGDATVPVGPGHNAVNSNNGQLVIAPVWSAGFRFLVNPAVGVDLYATNSMGYTPVTRTLPFLPDGTSIAIGTGLTYTPDIGQGFLPSFRTGPRVPLTERDRQLLLDGITITSANTLEPEMVRFHGNVGGVGNGVNVAIGLTEDTHFEFATEKLANGATLLPGVNYNGDQNFGLAAKVRLLDQVQGDPFSLGFRGSFNRGVSGSNSLAILELPMNYRPMNSLALFFNPKVGLFSAHTVAVGLGFGGNLEVLPGLQLIAEATPVVTGEKTVFSGGIRYTIPNINLSFDLYGSNAAGQSLAAGGLIGQSSPSIGFNINWLFGGRN